MADVETTLLELRVIEGVAFPRRLKNGDVVVLDNAEIDHWAVEHVTKPEPAAASGCYEDADLLLLFEETHGPAEELVDRSYTDSVANES